MWNVNVKHNKLMFLGCLHQRSWRDKIFKNIFKIITCEILINRVITILIKYNY